MTPEEAVGAKIPPDDEIIDDPAMITFGDLYWRAMSNFTLLGHIISTSLFAAGVYMGGSRGLVTVLSILLSWAMVYFSEMRFIQTRTDKLLRFVQWPVIVLVVLAGLNVVLRMAGF